MHAHRSTLSETKRRALFETRILFVHALLLFIVLLVLGRLIELQIVKGNDYRTQAQKQQFGGVVLSAKRGEILSKNSKSGETSILATNTTLDLLYADPAIIDSGHAQIADELAAILVTPNFDAGCRAGSTDCPTELIQFYKPAFDPLRKVKIVETISASGGYIVSLETGATVFSGSGGFLPDLTEVRRLFARSVEEKIRRKTVTFVPLLYGANKQQVAEIDAMNIVGVDVNADQSLVYANPDEVDQDAITDIARQVAPVLNMDPAIIRSRLYQRPLRYVPIMGKLSPELSRHVRELKLRYAEKIQAEIVKLSTSGKRASIDDPFRGLALIPEHWRFYPDTKITSHVVGFINAVQEPQYGVERAFDTILRGQEGLIASVKDPSGGQIVSADQQFVDPEDGSTIVLTIDRLIQSKVEDLLEAMVKKVDAESGQVIIMDPFTGRVLAMANAPLFDNNNYAAVYAKEPIVIDAEREKQIVVEVYDPENNTRVVKAYLPDIAPGGRDALSPETKVKLAELEKLYDLESITRYYNYIGENNRREIFPTLQKSVWLKYKNNIGVGSYVNRTVQEVYEPGSVMKPITMAIAIDQGEVRPGDIYNDTGAVKVDIYTIKNALNKYYGKVTMVDCIDFSINTCMTSVSNKLGRKLFHAALQQFGFGRVTGIELDNELPGNLRPVREWNPALVMTMAFGQGISVTPMQMITALAAIANGGKLMRPTIIDEVRRADGTIEKNLPESLSQVIKPETSATLTAILTHGAQFGFAKAGKVKGHRIAGKTGTSQIAGPGGKYETGTGSTIATYAGYAPVDSPKFIILVKLDRPRKDDFGSLSAAPLFRDIAAFLFEYYDIPPDEK